MGIFSDKLKSIEESSEVIFEIEFSDNKLIIRSGDDMIWNNLLEFTEGGYPDFKFRFENNAPRKVNIMPIVQNDEKQKHGARVKIKHPFSSNTIGTRTLIFDRDDDGNIIEVSASKYKNQSKKSGELKDYDIKSDYIDAAFSLIASNPKLIDDFISGKASKYDVENYIDTVYNKLSNKDKRNYVKKINII